MLRYNINLAEGSIWPRWKRLLTYRLLIVYLFLMALLLLTAAARAAVNIRCGVRYYRKSREIQRQFALLHPENADLLEHARGLKEQLDRDAACVESIDSALPPSVHTPLPALVLLANQPNKGMLHKFSFSQQAKKDPVKVHFDLITPVGSSRNGSSSKAFMEQWQKDPVLSHQFPEIRQIQVRRTELASGPVFITQYEAISKD